MSMKRAAGIGGLIVLVLVVGAVLAVDRLAASALEDALARTFGTEVSVESVEIGFLSGEVTAEGIVVANPGTFESPYFTTLADTRVTTGITDLLGDTVVVRRMELEGLELHLERRGTETNFGPVLRRVKAAREADEADEKRYRVEELVVKSSTARVRLGAEGQPTEFEIPRIRLTDLGTGSQEAMSLSRLAGAVLEAALRGVLQRSDAISGALSGLLRSEIDGLEQMPDGAEVRFEGLDGEGVEEEVKDAVEGILPGGG